MKTGPFNLDDLTPEQIGKLFPVRVVPYNPNWKTLFEQEKALITNTLSGLKVLNVEHFGSTSVIGLAAKPTIDILVEVQHLSKNLKQSITKMLGTIGYGNMQNTDGENKMTFGKGYDKGDVDIQTYHVHIREKSIKPQDEIYFRDYLRQHPNVRDEYSRLKYELAEKYQFNREDYTQAKTDFIKRVTELQKKEFEL